MSAYFNRPMGGGDLRMCYVRTAHELNYVASTRLSHRPIDILHRMYWNDIHDTVQ